MSLAHVISPLNPPPTEVGTSATCPADCRGHCCHARERTLLTLQSRSGLSRQQVAESTGTGLDGAVPLISESAPPPVENKESSFKESYRTSFMIFHVLVGVYDTACTPNTE